MPKILVIEDDHSIRENLQEFLELLKFQVATAANGTEGVCLMQTENPDLILCDVHLPKMDGYQVLEYVKSKSETARVPFVFVTSSPQKSEIEKGNLSGADAYLVKSFQFEDLQNTIENLLGKL